jgi:hypothetical protein
MMAVAMIAAPHLWQQVEDCWQDAYDRALADRDRFDVFVRSAAA